MATLHPTIVPFPLVDISTIIIWYYHCQTKANSSNYGKPWQTMAESASLLQFAMGRTMANSSKLWQTLANSDLPRQTMAESASLLQFA